MLAWLLLCGAAVCAEAPQVFLAPILYGTALALAAAAAAVLLFICAEGREQDPLIYLKFLSARKAR